MNNSFNIRTATADDVPVLFNLIKGLAKYEKLSHEMTASEALFTKYGFGENTYFQALIAESADNKAVGFALYFYTFSTFLGKPSLYLEDLFVVPELRGNGVGKALLQQLAQIAVERDCGRMEWAVLNWNQPAIDFYHALGAAPLSEWITFRLTGDSLKRLAENAGIE